LFLVCFKQPAPLGLLENDRSTLRSDEWNLLSNIISSYDEQNQIHRVKHLLNQKCSLLPKLRTKSADTLNTINEMMTGIQPLIERSPHFQLLSSEARRSVILHNLLITGGVNAVFISREANAFQNAAYVTAITLLYGTDLVMSFVQRNERLETNGNLIKLLVFVLIFSNNCSIVLFNEHENIEMISSSIELFRIQDIYVNILWRYLLYLYGHNEAVLRFSSLIRTVLDTINMGKQVIENLAHKTLMNRIVTQTERSLTITN
jgi:hypothetical protein